MRYNQSSSYKKKQRNSQPNFQSNLDSHLQHFDNEVNQEFAWDSILRRRINLDGSVELLVNWRDYPDPQW